VIPTANGDLAVPANAGPYTDPSGKTPATVDVYNSANPQLLSQTTNADRPLIDYHIHPAGTIVNDSSSKSGGGTYVIGGTTQTAEFRQSPKYSPTDIPNAAQPGRQTLLGYHIVVGAGDKKAYFYNGKGVLGHMPLDKFVSIK
jgi:hypothetical protein